MRFPKRISIFMSLVGVMAFAACSDGMIAGNTFQSSLAPKTMESPLPAAALVEVTLQPTPLHASTATAMPGFPTSIPPVNGPCIQLAQFEANLGNNVCIAAKILATENWDSDFVMWLDQTPATRYIVVHNTFYLGAEGNCMQITGVVQRDTEGRLFIRADDPGQVNPCPK